MVQANQVDDVPLLPGQWYIMHNLRMVSHLGTHIEVPYHINRDGADTADVPLERLVGEAVVLDLRGLEPKAEISLEQVRTAAESAGGIQAGDRVLIQTGWDKLYDRPEYRWPPYLSPEATRWLVEDQQASLLGIDTRGAEVPGNAEHVNHHMMLDRGVPHIENLCNLDQLTRKRVFLFAAPLAVRGLESMPLRVIALEVGD